MLYQKIIINDKSGVSWRIWETIVGRMSMRGLLQNTPTAIKLGLGNNGKSSPKGRKPWSKSSRDGLPNVE